MDEFERWLKTVCFREPTPAAYDLAKCAWLEATKCAWLEATKGSRDRIAEQALAGGSPAEAKVVFAYPDAGTSADRYHLQSLGLEKGNVYTVDSARVWPDKGKLYLSELPGESFNPDNFAWATTQEAQAPRAERLTDKRKEHGI